ncbi:hypothetical protein Poli38472_011021 [Pythium oligandrum]|uniref:Uncharacterized protein n=1 Tax=Pythium oligandrum TaxID=41045 RepID=A0A8K1CPG5_PYTOL|nr:hypothetical protein Poli38472_011021 [Pythium oligandrum]|eukprot:TMW67401.1 hypothetical protein Poli38472_011021 [Pythium oligandrum]
MRSFVPIVLSLVALFASIVRADNCSYALTAFSGSEWKITCDNDTDIADATEFDPSLLTTIRIGKYENVELSPKTAPQPVEVHVPTSFAHVGPLVSSKLTIFNLQRDAGIKMTSAVEFDAEAFAQMTALQKLTLGFYNISLTEDSWVFPPSLNEITINHGALTTFEATGVNGATLNITKLNLRYNKLQRIPTVVFTTRSLIFADLFGIDFPPLQMSRRRVARLLRLIKQGKILLGKIADFTDDCKGEKQTIAAPSGNYLICVSESDDEGDDLIVEDDGSATESTEASSTDGSKPIAATPTSSSDDSTAGAPSSNVETPTPSAGRRCTVQLITALAASIVFLAVHCLPSSL